MSEHMPRPLEVRRHPNPGFGWEVYEPDTGLVVATVPIDETYDEAADARWSRTVANLFAAAPDMADALQAVLARDGDWMGKCRAAIERAGIS